MSIRFDTVVIGCLNVRAQISFYKEVFSFEEKENDPRWKDPDGSVRMTVPRFCGHSPEFLFLSSVTQPPAKTKACDTGYTHLCFESTNVWATVRAILSHGGTMLSQFSDCHKQVALYLYDPENNIIELHVPLPEPFQLRVAAGTIVALLHAKLGLSQNANAHQTRFLHVNIVSQNWKAMADFYKAAFGGKQIGKHRDYQDDYIVLLTGVGKPVHVVGEHVNLPGNKRNVTTVEIFTYDPATERSPRELTDCGIIAIDFSTDHLPQTEEALCAAGGTCVSRDGMLACWRDLDGNLIRIRLRDI